MAGFWGISSTDAGPALDEPPITDALDPLGVGAALAAGTADRRLVSASPPVPGTQGSHHYVDDDYIAACSGELTRPDFDAGLVRALASDDADATAASMRGTFAVSILCRRTGRARLISDRTSQHPLFWRRIAGGYFWSSTMAPFCRLPDEPRFDHAWLYEFLYFNYPLGMRTFLDGVLRVPAAAILDLDPAAGTATARRYADPYRPGVPLLSESESVDRGLEVFGAVMARSLQMPAATIIALTSGMDSRTLLSFVPGDALTDLASYTYGVSGCLDVAGAADIANALSLHHHHVALDERFVGKLPDLGWWTVFLSGGLQSIMRATLPYAYASLQTLLPERRFLLHGAAGDHLFRDHLLGSGNRPHILSEPFDLTLQHGHVVMDQDYFRALLGKRFEDFRTHVDMAVDTLVEEYGELADPDAYLKVLLYEAGPKYFAGEAAIANHWYRVERPFMDADAVELAWSSPFGVAEASRRSPRQRRYGERRYQALLIGRSETTRGVPLYDRPIEAYHARWPWRYHLHSLRLVPRRLRERLGPRRPNLEEWSTWFEHRLSGTLRDLLGRDCRLGAYLPATALDRALADGGIHLLGKLATAEILLRLIEARWRLPADVAPLPGGAAARGN